MTAAPNKRNLLHWLLVFFLFVPVIIFYTFHFYSPLRAQGLIPTGFIGYDMFYYMANAREYYDNESFHLFYQNPFSGVYDNKYIYFQPHIFLLGLLMKIVGDHPGLVYCLFGLLSGLICLKIIISFVDAWVVLDSAPKIMALTVLCWGGGLLSLAGILFLLCSGHPLPHAYMHSGIFDPFDGWWFLNLGRNLVYPTEAYYHAVFLGAVFSVYLKRYPLFLSLVFLLCLSHPFSGTELLLVSLCYFFIERFFVKNTDIPAYVLNWLAVIAVLHFGYYLVYLMQDPEHSVLVGQWRKNWGLGPDTIIFAYGLAGGLFIFNIRSLQRARNYFSNSFHRLLLVWFFVAFLLANHEFIINPAIQPIHFTRGYIWIPLLLMGFPSLTGLLSLLWQRRVYRYALVPLLLFVLLSDNLIWLSVHAWEISNNRYIYTDADLEKLFSELNRPEYRSSLVISNDFRISYWTTVYTPLRSWYSHDFNTPHNMVRGLDVNLFYKKGIVSENWKGRRCVIILNKQKGISQDAVTALRQMEKKYENHTYIVYMVNFHQ